jgi:hypothetical protein
MNGERVLSQGTVGEFIDSHKQRVVAIAASVACLTAVAPTEAYIVHDTTVTPQTEQMNTVRASKANSKNQPIFTAGEGMTPTYLTELNRMVLNYDLPIPASQIKTTLGKTQEYCGGAASESKTVNNIAMCINPTTNEMHMAKMPLWQIASYAAHEIEGHEIPDAIRDKEKRLRPGKPSTFFVNFFIAAGMAKDQKESLKIIRSGPIDQKVSKDMRKKGVYADEALAEVAASCAQGGFMLAKGDTFVGHITNTTTVTLSEESYTAACNYLDTEYKKHPAITKPTNKTPNPTPMRFNYYDNRFCSNKENTSNTWPHPDYAWPQWQRACRDSD